MGFFSNLLGKKKPEPVPFPEKLSTATTKKEKTKVMPTVKATPALFYAYRRVFYDTMPTVSPFTKAEVDAIYALISQSDGGHLGKVWIKDVYARFFAEKEWVWPEYEHWLAVFAEAQAPYKKRTEKKRFELLFLTMEHRAKSLMDAEDRRRLGFLKVKTEYVLEWEKPFVKKALKDNPEALHPMFPGSLAFCVVVDENYEESEGIADVSNLG